MKKVNWILISWGIIILLLLGIFLGKNYYDNKLEEAYTENRTLIISKDSLQKISDTQYRKLVADTLKQKELNKIVDSLKIELKAKPKIVIQTEYIPKDVPEGPIDSVGVLNDTLSIEDYYPQKQNYFVKYTARINTTTEDGLGKFDLKPFNINLIISQRKDGIFQLDSQVPDWLGVNNIQVQALPMTVPKTDNFGWIVGGSYGKDFNTFENYLRVNGGIRYKKVYIIGGASTNKNVDIGAQIEF